MFSNIFGSTPAESNQEEQSHRPTTRSQSRSNPNQLQLPADAVSHFNGVARGRRSPSPLHVGHNANSAVIFAYDSTNISQQLLRPQQQPVDAEEFADAVDKNASTTTTSMSLSQSSVDELRAAAAAAVEAANAATAALVAASGLVTQQSSQQQQNVNQIRTRKPELPEFDSKNIEIWIRRVQAAYDRAAIVLPKDKFAFLETKFAVGANPTIDAYLYGPATEEAWSSFLAYLKEEYGRTIRQEAQFIRDQHSRDGRKPSQMLAHMKDRVRRVTVDDILKEIVISSLPASVQQMITERVKHMTADEAAAVADQYFDQEGRPLHSSSPSIQHVDAPQVESTHAGDCDDYDDGCDVNAIRGGRGQFRGGFRKYNNNNRQSRQNNNNFNGHGGGQQRTPPNAPAPFSNGGQKGGQQRPPPNASSTASAAASSGGSSKGPIVCMQHQRYGDKSYSCQQGCSMWPEFQRRQAGNAKAGTRM